VAAEQPLVCDGPHPQRRPDWCARTRQLRSLRPRVDVRGGGRPGHGQPATGRPAGCARLPRPGG
jgi:hypothetical protein